MNRTLPSVIKWLIIVSVAFFLLDKFTQSRFLYPWMALDPLDVLQRGQIWRLVTYMFLHDTRPPFMHILWNMLMLWMFGAPLVPVFGDRRFLIFYLSSGFFAGLCSLIFFGITQNPAPVIGASGGLFALLFAFAKLFPRQEFLLFFFFPVQARYAVLIIGGIELLMITSNDKFAHVAHLGGALYGWMWFSLEDRVMTMWGQWKRRKTSRIEKDLRKAEHEVNTVMVDIDPILKKISETGLNSLTAEEREILERASEVKRKQRAKIVRLEDWRQKKRDA